MNRRSLKIIGINPGTRYLGIAVLDGSELLDWRIKTLEGRWSDRKLKKAIEIVSDLIEQYEPNVLAIKKLHPSRSSMNLNFLVSRIKVLVKKKQINVRSHSIKELEKFFLTEGKPNKRNLAERIVMQYPVLATDLNKEKYYKDAYHLRMIEAVALVSMGIIEKNI